VSRHWVLNASPVIALGATGQVALLTDLSEQAVIPSAVAEEILRGPADCPAVQWLNKEGSELVRPVEAPDPAVLAWDLGRCETEVISWARRHPDFEAVLDGRAAEVCAAVFNVPVRGTLGVVLLAKRLGRIPAVAPVLSALEQAGFRIDPLLRTQIIQHAGE
jgi:predicted nucleic acid-binding protein